MSRKPNEYKQIISILNRLHIIHPTYNIGRHLSTAFDEYENLWGVSDEIFLRQLKRYTNELESDIQHTDDDIEQILLDGMNLTSDIEEEDY